MLPGLKKQPYKFLSVKYSLPLWLSKKWIASYGFQSTQQLCIQINTIPTITIRTNTLKTDRQSLMEELTSNVKNLEKTNYVQEGLSFTNPDVPIHELDEFSKGLFRVQDEAAQIITHFLSPQPGEKILDACAGFGGKTSHIAQIMKNRGEITAADTGAKKLESLKTEMQKLGIDIVNTKTIDILKSSIKDFKFYFDRVLIDAPCTGLGVLRRNPDTKWKRSKNDIIRLGAKQKKMLNSAANLVKPGGVLVYAVCSCEKEENEDVIDKFLEKRKDFYLDQNLKADKNQKTDKILQSNGILQPNENLINDETLKNDKKVKNEIYASLITENGFLKTYPNINNMDGFFAARLIRKQVKTD